MRLIRMTTHSRRRPFVRPPPPLEPNPPTRIINTNRSSSCWHAPIPRSRRCGACPRRPLFGAGVRCSSCWTTTSPVRRVCYSSTLAAVCRFCLCFFCLHGPWCTAVRRAALLLWAACSRFALAPPPLRAELAFFLSAFLMCVFLSFFQVFVVGVVVAADFRRKTTFCFLPFFRSPRDNQT